MNSVQSEHDYKNNEDQEINCKINAEQLPSTMLIPDVVSLNVGGVIHTTSLTTLKKSPCSMLAAMFSGRHKLTQDGNGRYFIDRDGALFRHVVNFLRQGILPPLHESLQVYHEAQFFNIQEMCEALEMLHPVAGEKFRNDFLNHVPSYENNLHLLVSEAQHIASLQPERVSKLRVCIFKEESVHYSNSFQSDSTATTSLCRSKHNCDVHVTFGPWRATPGVYDLIDCICADLAKKGYRLEQECIGVCDQHIFGQYFCKRPIFEFKFKWW